MRARFALVTVLSGLTLGCVSNAPTEPPTPVSLARRAATVERVPLAGVLRAPASLIGNNGGGLISDKGLGMVVRTAFQVLAAERWQPVPAATVRLAHPDGSPVEGVAAVQTDEHGRFQLDAVPAGHLYRVQAAAIAVHFETLVRPEAEGVVTVVDPATTIVASHLRGQLAGAIDRVPAARFEDISRQVRETLEREEMTIDLSSAEAMAAVFERVSQSAPTLRETEAELVSEATRPAADAPEAETPLPDPTPRATDRPSPAPAGTILLSAPVGQTPRRLAFDPQGRLWVSNQADNTVARLEATGAVAATFPVGFSPYGLAFDPAGRVWVANRGSNSLSRIDLASGETAAFPVGQAPEGVAVAPNGDVWVSAYNARTLTRLHPETGEALQTVSGVGLVTRLAITPTGDLWALRWGDQGLTRVAADGTERHVTLGPHPSGLAMTASGEAWVAVTGANKLCRVASDGTVAQEVPTAEAPAAVAIAGRPCGSAMPAAA
ncbi:MAG: hypothetical protein ACLGIN_01480, partial [Candidatus Sericytochromatia bacterium]